MQPIRLWEKGACSDFRVRVCIGTRGTTNGFRSVSVVEGGVLPCGIGGYATPNASHCFAISAFFIIRILLDLLHTLMQRARNIRIKLGEV